MVKAATAFAPLLASTKDYEVIKEIVLNFRKIPQM